MISVRRTGSMSIVLVCLVTALLLAACGGTPAPVTTAPTTSSAATDSVSPQETTAAAEPTLAPDNNASGEKITLRLWSHQNAAFQQANDAIIAKFMQANPNIEVKYETFEYDMFLQTLQTSMPAGTEADVIEMFGTWVCSYARGNRLSEMPLELMTYDQATEKFFKAPLDGYYCDGKLYGLPQEFNLENGGALVNPAYFEEAGVTYPPRWGNFNDLITDAAKMTKTENNTMERAGFEFTTGDGISFTFLAGILQQGSNYFAEDGKHFNFDTPEARNIVQLMVDMAQKHKVVDPITFNDESNPTADAFFAGRSAIGFVGSWAAGEGRINYPDLKFDYVEIPPYFGSEQRFAADSGWGKVVSVNSKHQEAAWKLAMFMTNEQENALIWNTTTSTIPATKALVEQPTILQTAPWLEPTFNLLPKGEYIGDLTDRDQLFYEIIYPHVLDAMQGNVSVDDAVTAIHTEANAIVDAR